MAILEILEFPDPRLRTIAEPVTVFDAALRRVIDDMFETMYAAPGIGLAATQVNYHKRLLVLDISDDKNEPRVFINPSFEPVDQGMQDYNEGCLSVPGYYDIVTRHDRIRVKAMDGHGQPFELEASGLLSVCIQHEMDHLDGKLFVDYLSRLKRERVKSKLEKARSRRA